MCEKAVNGIETTSMLNEHTTLNELTTDLKAVKTCWSLVDGFLPSTGSKSVKVRWVAWKTSGASIRSWSITALVRRGCGGLICGPAARMLHAIVPRMLRHKDGPERRLRRRLDPTFSAADSAHGEPLVCTAHDLCRSCCTVKPTRCPIG